MAVPVRNANVVALFPLQETIWNKDGTGALASGVVSFFSDPAFTVPKDVYEETLDPLSGVVTYTNLGNVLILSGIGSFVDGVGNNFIPLLYPYVGTPDDATVGDFEPYFITVYSSDGIFQFSTSDWPPNSFSESSSSSAQEALTNNLLTNSQFSVVNFTPDPLTSTYTYSVSGTASNILAPGWTLNTVGTATVTVSQISLSSTIPTEAPYALRVAWSTGLTSLQIVQQLTNSPRIIAGSNASASITAESSSAISLELHYISGDVSPIDITLASGTTLNTSTFETISGTEAIPATSTQSASGYVNFAIEILSLTVGAFVELTSAQLVEVATSSIVAGYIQETTQQQLNGLMWYYEPQLAIKPIPSYTLGWDFGLNPCQALGASVGVSGLAANKARYIADQTIAFESVGNSLSYTFSNALGITISTTTPTQFALIQYLDAHMAAELLANPMAVEILGESTASINANVSLWYTTNASLPNVASGTNATFFASLTAGVPTTITAGWTQVSRNGLGAANFTCNSTQQMFDFNNWSDGTAVGSVTFFAIVIGFASLPSTSSVSLRYASLCSGYFATKPAPLNPAQTLQALQYYYQKSFIPGVVPAQNVGLGNGESYGGATVFPGTQTTVKGPSPYFAVPMRAPAGSYPIITTYNPADVNAFIYDITQGSSFTATTVVNPSNNGFTTNGTSASASAANQGSTLAINWTADARLGLV